MKQKELKRLRRTELLELLLELSRENDQLRKANMDLKKQLQDRTITVENAGSLADAALQLNGVFEAAQNACEQYIQNIHSRSQNLEDYCRQMEERTREKCDEMIAKAREEAQLCLEQAKQDSTAQNDTLMWLSQIMDGGETL